MSLRKLSTAVLLVASLAAPSRAQNAPPGDSPRQLSLSGAVHLALAHNHVVRIAQFQVEAKQHAKEVARSAYFPQISNETTAVQVTDTQFIQIAAGSLGNSGGAGIPAQNVTLNQGGHTLIVSGTGLVQPLTQLFTKVRPENDIARADLNASRDSARQTENEIALKVHQLYYGILVAELRRKAAEARIKAADDLKAERQQQVKFGSALEQDLIESQAAALQARQDLLTTELQLSDLTMQLDDLMGLPVSTPLQLDPSVPAVPDVCKLEDCVKAALESHPEILEAREEVSKAAAAVKLSKADYFPDVSAIARYSYSDQVPFLARNFGTFGGQLTYDIFDGGRRRAQVAESNSDLAKAKENLARVTEDVELQLQIAYNKLQRTREMVGVSQEALDLRTEASRVYSQQLQRGEALPSQSDQAVAQEFQARMLLLQSQLDFIQAYDEVTTAMGKTPE